MVKKTTVVNEPRKRPVILTLMSPTAEQLKEEPETIWVVLSWNSGQKHAAAEAYSGKRFKFGPSERDETSVRIKTGYHHEHMVYGEESSASLPYYTLLSSLVKYSNGEVNYDRLVDDAAQIASLSRGFGRHLDDWVNRRKDYPWFF